MSNPKRKMEKRLANRHKAYSEAEKTANAKLKFHKPGSQTK